MSAMGLSERHRQSLLGLVLLAILGLSVLAAWTMVQARQAPADRGKDMLRGIRTRTLSSYWGSQESSRWYLVRDSAGRSVGYMVRARKPVEKGHSGLTLMRMGNVQHGESWALDAAATQGSYTSTIGGRGVLDTQITLRDDQVTVSRPWEGGSGKATSPAPGNYIPEGLMPLIVAEVSRTAAETRFCFIYDPESITREGVHFTAITMTPQGDGKVRLRSKFLQDEMDEVYHLDAAGEVDRIDDNITGASTRSIDLRSLGKLFPEVLELQQRLENEAIDAGKDEDVEDIEDIEEKFPALSDGPREAGL
jgi:hypothetical protein